MLVPRVVTHAPFVLIPLVRLPQGAYWLPLRLTGLLPNIFEPSLTPLAGWDAGVDSWIA